ncbi:MAG: diphthine--ammonia ligase [Candidatus Nanohaloarchaea archaeon]
MCGIAGGEKAERIINHLEHRGSSSRCDGEVAHVLHSVVGEVEQPLEGEGTLVANCEIYNYKELAGEHDFNVENDAELLLKLLDDEGVEKTLELVDGIYAFAYRNNGKTFLARDLLGVNPVWYSEEPFAYASEKQALEKEGLDARELHPRHVLVYSHEEETLETRQRDFFEINEKERSVEENAEKVKELFLEAVEKRVPETELGLLFSGGLDSTLIAAALQELGKEFTCYTAGIQHGNVNAPRDVEWAEEVAEEMDLELEVYEADLDEVEQKLKDTTDWISSTSVVKNGVALPFDFALMRKPEVFSSSRNSEGVSSREKVVMSGLGSEQLYAGYSRQQGYLNKDCLSGLRGMFEQDLYRDNVIAFRNGYELRVPFLDHDLIEHALTVPGEQKVSDGYRKYVLRRAAEKLGVPEDVAWRKKTAAQYGSNFDKAISRLAKDNGFEHKQEYLNSFREKHNRKLAALTSGGKDSNAALYRMERRNNEISCLVNVHSENRDSYMFDSKQLEVVEEQSEKLGIPLIVADTEGEKEKELEDLENGLRAAKKEYGVEGVVAGALASTYQRDRVDRVAEKVGLKVFTPLWRENQENYLRWLIEEGFQVEITSVAARGLEERWEGEVLDEDSVEELIELSTEYGFNAAGEGGEYETRVLEFPEQLRQL